MPSGLQLFQLFKVFSHLKHENMLTYWHTDKYVSSLLIGYSKERGRYRTAFTNVCLSVWQSISDTADCQKDNKEITRKKQYG